MAADLGKRLEQAVGWFWRTRREQALRQQEGGRTDRGGRSAVTGGAQMDGFARLLADLVTDAGVPEATVYGKRRLELPGFFRPTKEWDLLVVHEGRLLVAVEVKAQVGPSFGNNFNNRVEEALGSAVDLWTAYREGVFSPSPRPWLGYLMLLEDCAGSRSPVAVRQPHFATLPEFQEASYAGRYEQFCLKIVRERHYDAAAFIISKRPEGEGVLYTEPSAELGFTRFAASLRAHVQAYAEEEVR
ncbi:MAG: hypothetical protein AMK73_09975 [Planctomycetes bacterium SM23_32]|nr:MAG: hypothetical protein AMK73_09975 [Planctomycetes bacterium SM23_32]